MNWIVEKAKNGENTLNLNGINIYSKYKPKNDVKRFMENEVDLSKSKFLIVGLGLGYHIDFLLEHMENIQIEYIVLDSNEEALCNKFNLDLLSNSRVTSFKNNNEFLQDAQIIIPPAFLTAIGNQHPLYDFIDDIKIRQQSYKRFKEEMAQNFTENKKKFSPIKKIKKENETAILVASGPSLSKNIKILKEISEKFDIFSVGSALNSLLIEGIQPKAVFISDAQDAIIEQIKIAYQGPLYALSTANYRAVNKHRGTSHIIFQKGYKNAELFAKENNQPLFETGGSVSTLALSFIEWLDYEKLILVGLDLGFDGVSTHAENSTSGRVVDSNFQLREIESNDGTLIHSTPNLLAYKRWVEKKLIDTKMVVINTAKKGAKIKGTIAEELIKFK